MKILMVCLGNICRSPLAEGILKNKVQNKNLGWKIDSAGTGSWHIGELPDSRSINIAGKYGIDITDQRARQFSKEDFDNFDLILAMDSSNYNNIKSLARNSEDMTKVELIMNYLYPNKNIAVPDPYYDGSFDNVFQLIDSACDALIDNLEKNNI